MTKKCNNANGKLQAIRHSVQGSTRALCGGQLSLQCTMKHPGFRFSFRKTSHAPRPMPNPLQTQASSRLAIVLHCPVGGAPTVDSQQRTYIPIYLMTTAHTPTIAIPIGMNAVTTPQMKTSRSHVGSPSPQSSVSPARST